MIMVVVMAPIGVRACVLWWWLRSGEVEVVGQASSTSVVIVVAPPVLQGSRHCHGCHRRASVCCRQSLSLSLCLSMLEMLLLSP